MIKQHEISNEKTCSCHINIIYRKEIKFVGEILIVGYLNKTTYGINHQQTG
jgi:hypothetical protein